MPKNQNHIYDFDLIVIGSGSGGSVGAHLAADMGKRVAVIEDDVIGGECPNYGCIPTKSILRAVKIYEEAKLGKELGLRASTLNLSYPAVMKWKQKAIGRTGVVKGEEAYRKSGIKLIHGHAHFLSNHEVSVNGRRYSARYFLVATGAKPFIPQVPGLNEVGYLTYREILELKKPPKSLIIIGGGAIGCEFAQIYSAFKSKVALIEYAPWLLPREDQELGLLIEDIYKTKKGIDVKTGAKVVEARKAKTKKEVAFEQHGVINKVSADEILMAAGKRPNVDLGLENAGVKYSPHGIKINRFIQTSQKNIFAVGDVTGQYMFTHTAVYQAKLAIHNMFSRKRNWHTADYSSIPRALFITPEASAVGITEKEAKLRKLKYKVGFAPISVLARANTDNFDVGFVKVIALNNGAIIGGSVVSPGAGEIIHELAVAIKNGVTVQDIAHTVHAFPTWSEAVHVACAQIA